MTKMGENFFPKTTTAAVVDEATGKTLDTMIPCQFSVEILSGGTEDDFNALKDAISLKKEIVFISEGNSPFPAYGIYAEDSDIILLWVHVYSSTESATLVFASMESSGKVEVLNRFPLSVKAGQGVEIDPDGTISTKIDSNPFIVPSDGNLPVEGQDGKIYLIPASNAGEQNVMLEYVWVNGAWEKFGEFTTDVDMSQYAKVIDITGLKGAEIYNIVYKNLGNALYFRDDRYYVYGGNYNSIYYYLISLQNGNGNFLYSDKTPLITLLEITRSGISVMYKTLVISDQLSAYGKVEDSVYKITSLDQILPTAVKDTYRPVMLKKGDTGGIAIPVTLDSWRDGVYVREVRTYVSDGYIHTYRVLNVGGSSETKQELLEVARTLSESTELSPKTYNALGTLAADTTLTMNAGRHPVPEYQGEFSFGDTVYAVTFPEEVIWNVAPTYRANKRYQFSILNGLGVMCEFPLSNETSE